MYQINLLPNTGRTDQTQRYNMTTPESLPPKHACQCSPSRKQVHFSLEGENRRWKCWKSCLFRPRPRSPNIPPSLVLAEHTVPRIVTHFTYISTWTATAVQEMDWKGTGGVGWKVVERKERAYNTIYKTIDYRPRNDSLGRPYSPAARRRCAWLANAGCIFVGGHGGVEETNLF